jgi:AraC-like DNA-binding protein
MKLGYIGYGEAAYFMSAGLAEQGVEQYACSRNFSYKGKPEDVGVKRCASYEELFSICDTVFAMTPNTAAVPTASEDRALDTVKAAIVYIREHYGEQLTLEGIAAHVLTDKYTLLRDFKRITGDSVFSYLIGYRCKMALLMLSDGADVAEAAYATGFSNLSYFSKTFRAKVGKLPSECKAGAQDGRAPAHP